MAEDTKDKMEQPYFMNGTQMDCESTRKQLLKAGALENCMKSSVIHSLEKTGR
jgi:hypothetical protein